MTELQELQRDFKRLEIKLLELNIGERLDAIEKQLKGIRDGEAGFYPAKKIENEINKIKKQISEKNIKKSRDKRIYSRRR